MISIKKNKQRNKHNSEMRLLSRVLWKLGGFYQSQKWNLSSIKLFQHLPCLTAGDNTKLRGRC